MEFTSNSYSNQALKNKPDKETKSKFCDTYTYLWTAYSNYARFWFTKQGGTNGWTAAIKSCDHVGCFSWSCDSLP